LWNRLRRQIEIIRHKTGKGVAKAVRGLRVPGEPKIARFGPSSAQPEGKRFANSPGVAENYASRTGSIRMHSLVAFLARPGFRETGVACVFEGAEAQRLEFDCAIEL
jgi:hypothetical protein